MREGARVINKIFNPPSMFKKNLNDFSENHKTFFRIQPLRKKREYLEIPPGEWTICLRDHSKQKKMTSEYPVDGEI